MERPTSPAEYLAALAARTSRRIVGLMSGTSLDALDVALVAIDGAGESCRLRLIDWKEYPFDPAVRERLRAAGELTGSDVEEVCILHAYLGHLFADRIRLFLDAAGVGTKDIDLIGMHGQTIRHLPVPRVIGGIAVRSTLQIGSGPTLAALLGIPVVSDFRSADMALGGEGAPLVPYTDYLLFRSAERNRIMLNIGGIANITLLPRNCAKDEVIAFDTGPGNMVIDTLARLLYREPLDRDGAIAARGVIRETLLTRLIDDEYFQRPFPKSTGRERFGVEYVKRMLALNAAEYRYPPEDLLATGTALTAESIRSGILLTGREWPDEIIVSGGGARNPFLMELLVRRIPSAFRRIDDFGIPVDAKESVCFAVFANEWLFGNQINMPLVTGAARGAVGGTLSWA